MALPVYLQILSNLRARLARGEWQVRERMPTDEELMQEFGVSRFTVRAAMDVLVADGLVARYRSRGSFVLARAEGAVTWMVTSLEDMVVNGFPTRPIILDAATGPHEPAISSALGLEEGARSLRIRVLRQSDGLPYNYSVIYIPEGLAGRLPADWQARTAEAPFVGLVAEANTTSIQRTVQVAQSVAAAPEVARQLDVATGTPLLLLERTFYSREGIAIEYAQAYSRSDRYRQILALRSGQPPQEASAAEPERTNE